MRKLLSCFVVLLLYCFIVVTPVAASDSWKNLPQNSCPPYPVISACNLNYIMETNAISLTNMITGANSGLISGLSLLYKDPPVSSRDYISYMGSKFHIPGAPVNAYAADGGLGYNNLGPVLKIWVVMRNLAYFVFAIIFVVVGIMILIRAKIDPKTTINIQNALPKMVLALILVTFSYAIAGFLIDLMYVALALVVTITASANVSINGIAVGSSTTDLGKNILAHNLFWAWFDPGTNMWGMINNAGQATNTLLNAFLNGVGNQNITGPLGSLINGIAGGVVMLVVAIAILWALFKTWFSLLSAYANIILGIIFSPLQLMLDAIPGQNQFDGWTRTMLANLLSFPTVLAMILIGMILANSNEMGAGATQGFSPPLIGASDQPAIQALIGIAIILTIPKTVEMLQEAIKAPKGKFGSAWGEAIGAAQRVGMAGAGRTYGAMTEETRLSRAGKEKARGQAYGEGNVPPPATNLSWRERFFGGGGGRS